MFMKNLVLSVLLIGAGSSSGWAADAVLPEITDPQAPEIRIDTTEWGGFYLGIYGGYSWFDAGVSGFGNDHGEGGELGVYAGYNWQLENRIVTGLEVLGGFSDGEANAGGVVVDQKWDASLRARLGYAFENSLLYSFAGLAVTGAEANAITGNDEQTLLGFTVGAGLETQIYEGVTARVEYGFENYSDETFALGAGTNPKIDLENQSVSVGIGIKF